MKQKHQEEVFYGIDQIFDPQNKLDETLKKQYPKLALDITPTTRHYPCHDLFRIYTFNLLRELSKKFDIILVYRDLQATVDISLEESKRLIEENISLLHGSGVPFKVYYESEILQKHLSNMPERFFLHLYNTILHKSHNHFNRHIMYSSASLAVLMPLLEMLKVDVLLCMEEEKENVEILKNIYKNDSEYFPVIFYRSLRDLQNKKHSSSDKKRVFPNLDWTKEKIYEQFKDHDTNFNTFHDWYKKLGLLENKIFELGDKKISFVQLCNLFKSKKINKNKALKFVADYLADLMAKEGKFLEIASKELKISFNNSNSGKLINSLSTPSRINIIRLLDKNNLPAYEIAKQIKVSLPTTLFHLLKLQEVGLIARDKNKKYSLKTNRLILYV